MTPRPQPGPSGPTTRHVAPPGSGASQKAIAFRRRAPRVMPTLAVLAASVLSGCLLDIYGGAPRAQLENRSTRPVLSITLGTPSSSAWKQTFSPPVEPGQRSRTFDLPAAGVLRLHATFEGADSAKDLEAKHYEAGTFTRIVVRDTSARQ